MTSVVERAYLDPLRTVERQVEIGAEGGEDSGGKCWGERDDELSGGPGGIGGGRRGSPAANDGGFRPVKRPGTCQGFCITIK